jgi:molecular chaperone DnaK (HSP70)
VLVFDLGGGTFDATIVEYQGLAYMRELAIDGDVNLGGRDFDNRLVKFCTDKLVGMDMGIDSPRTKARLAVECERAKIALSGKNVKKHL